MLKKKRRFAENLLLAALSLALLAAAWAQKKQTELSSALVRLHVLAVSDEADEQAIKLRVRDAVTAYLTPILLGADDADDAQRLLREALPSVRAAAETAAEGRRVTVTLTREYYPTRSYESFTLPAGAYSSLRVILGEGQGHNWWCVVFPPLCLSAADGDTLRETLGEEDYGIVTNGDGYALRFRLIELWGKLMSSLRDNP